MYNNDDIINEVRDQAIQIEQLESTISNLTDKIMDLSEILEEMGNYVKPSSVEMPEFEGTADALEKLTIRKSA
tara:strand:+ start:526 stop:744 length:219 start_codon:yes stop_codon:yes gene_type:complete